jgi:hypothetical protein
VGFFGVFWVRFFIANPACRLASSASKLAIARVWSSSCASMLAFAATYYDAKEKTIYFRQPQTEKNCGFS